ncbi:MAG: hypothetical protein JSW47_18705 [Phycisphaerales bacterium]|nr:MAG: hypothetical protein JSW47_18705 [Phycisphaerales bacterium]
MAKKIKYSKITIVIFLTVLIWVWADLALDETLPEKSAVVVVDESVAPTKYWISFNQSPSADIKITLSGPHTAVTTVDMELRKGLKPLEFVFNAVQEQMDKPGTHSLKLLEFLRKDRELRRRGLKVQSCDPNELSINVVELVTRPLAVECFDASGNPLKTQSIEPPKVDASVPVDSRLTAKIELTKAEIERARKAPIKKNPYVELAAEHRRESTAVMIKLAPEEDPLTVQRIEGATIGIDMSPTLLAKYYVEITNLPTVLSSIAVRATDEAKETYENQQYPHMTLYIFDGDIKEGQKGLRRAVHYNFPQEFVRKDEIELSQEQPAMAEFQIVPRPTAESE